MYAELPLWYLTLLEITHSVILMILVEEKHRKKYENNESTEIKALPGSNIHIFRYSESITVKFLWVNRYMSFFTFHTEAIGSIFGQDIFPKYNSLYYFTNFKWTWNTFVFREEDVFWRELSLRDTECRGVDCSPIFGSSAVWDQIEILNYIKDLLQC